MMLLFATMLLLLSRAVTGAVSRGGEQHAETPLQATKATTTMLLPAATGVCALAAARCCPLEGAAARGGRPHTETPLKATKATKTMLLPAAATAGLRRPRRGRGGAMSEGILGLLGDVEAGGAAAIHSELSGDKYRVLEERMRSKPGARGETVLPAPGRTPPARSAAPSQEKEAPVPATPTTSAAAKRTRSPTESGGGAPRAAKQKSSGAQITDFYATSTMATPLGGGGAGGQRAFSPPPRHSSVQTDPLAEEAEVRRLKEALSAAQRQARHADDSVEPFKAELARMKGLEQRSREQAVVWLRRLCRLEKAAAREGATRNSAHLGTVGWQRVGHNMSEVWEPGNAVRELHARQAELQAQKETIERDRRALAGQAKKRAAEVDAPGAEGGGTSGPAAVAEREEVLRLKAATLKRQEAALAEESARIERDKLLHIRELKRIRDEDGSRFNTQQLLSERYLLLELLGRGGFSEVYRAYDLLEHKEVACKIHQLSPHWSDERKANYTRHATREYAIHKTLRHDRIVALYDVFEIDAHTFATVLQFCNGGDLDALLKEHRSLPEKEARAIIYQFKSG
ncbi:hypothetical protein T492DRAFT_894871 [Pavlovales sp. CCMP2436]|nr:hypothetical protein T492DRAFT_894871 [Pavlovales sp. CCMP2436]